MIPRRRNPLAPYRWQWQLPDKTWVSDLQTAEHTWAEVDAHMRRLDQAIDDRRSG